MTNKEVAGKEDRYKKWSFPMPRVRGAKKKKKKNIPRPKDRKRDAVKGLRASTRNPREWE